jgi:four helix bundle protein
MNHEKKVCDLEERTALLGEGIIDFAKTLPHDRISNELVKQFIRSGTGIGANYMEADGAESKKDFRHKIALCKKEAKETKHWIRMIAKANPDRKKECKKIWQEAQELTLIFSTILNTSRKGK